MADRQEPVTLSGSGGQQVAQITGGSNSTQIADSLGAIILGFICIMLLLALLRSHKHTRKILEAQIKKLQTQLEKEK